MEYTDLMADYAKLRRDTTYVLYCEFGLKSARAAERMQRAGYEAYSFLGGVKALRSRAARGASEEREATLPDAVGRDA